MPPSPSRTEDAEQRDGIADGADGMRGDGRGRGAVGGEELGVRLEKNSEDEFGQDFGGGILRVAGGLGSLRAHMCDAAGIRPIFGEERDPRGGTLQRELARGFGDGRRAYGLKQGEQLGEILQEQSEIEVRAKVGG